MSDDRAPHLITIPSAYCEKARWALDRAALPSAKSRTRRCSRLATKHNEGGTVPVRVLETSLH